MLKPHLIFDTFLIKAPSQYLDDDESILGWPPPSIAISGGFGCSNFVFQKVFKCFGCSNLVFIKVFNGSATQILFSLMFSRALDAQALFSLRCLKGLDDQTVFALRF